MRILVIALMVTCCAAGIAQDTVCSYLNESNNGVMPQFSGGEEAFYKFLVSNIKYPQLAKEKGIHGRVILSFVIEKDGSLSNGVILISLGGGCDEEALRVVKMTDGMWTPGSKDGKLVRVRFVIPVKFTLKDVADSHDAAIAYNKGLSFLKEEKYEKAMAYFMIYQPGESLYPDAIYASGLCKYMLGETKGAILDWEAAKRSHYPDCGQKLAEAYLKLGNTYQAEKKYPASIACYSKALENSPTDINVLYNRGISFLFLGDKTKACEDWIKSRDSGSGDAQQLIDEYCK